MKKIQHIIENIAISFFFMIFSSLSFKQASNLASYIVSKIGPKLNFHKKAKKNIYNAFPLISEEKNEEYLKGMWDNIGRSIGEFPHIHHLSKKQYQLLVKVNNIENLDYLKNGGLVFSAHIGNWEILSCVFKDINKEICVIYREANNKYIDKKIKELRSKSNVTLIPKGKSGAKELIKAAKAKKIIILLVDQRLRDGINVPFFGKEAMTPSAIASLSLQYNLPISSLYSIRTEEKYKFEFFINKPLNIELTSNKNENVYNIMLEINKTIEEWVKKHPSQWFWIHNRWAKKKTHL